MTRAKQDRARKAKGADRQDTAQRIVDAADAVLGEMGWDALSAGEVAKRAGVNKALVFYHHGSRAGLLEKVLERYYLGHLEALRLAAEGEGSASARLHRTIDAYFDFIETHQRYPRLVQQLVAAGPEASALVQRALAPLFEWTLHILQGVTPAKGPLAARQFYVTFSGVVINYFTYTPVLGELWGADPLSRRALLERRGHVHWLVDAILAGLAREQASGRD